MSERGPEKLESRFLRVPGFEEFDHYKSRPNLRRVWIKLPLSILEEYRFTSLPEKTRFLILGLRCLAAQTDNRIPFDLTWIKERLHLRQKPNLEELLELGFLEVCLDESEESSRQSLDKVQTVEEEEKKNRRREKDLCSPEFETFWSAYPKKRRKPEALAAWQKLGSQRPFLPELLAGLECHKASQDWQKDSGKFIPHPAKWLKGHCWNDEPEPARRPSSAAGLDTERQSKYESIDQTSRKAAGGAA